MLIFSQKKCVVISAISFTEGGPLTILREAVESATLTLENWRIIVLVSKAQILNLSGVEVVEVPLGKYRWLSRLHWEYFKFKKFSHVIKVDLWLSLHDLTPNVICRRQIVYCHNPAPFYKIRIKYIKFDLSFFLFNLFYLYFYKINIKKNYAVIVQQNWIRNKFKSLINPNLNIIVAHPIQVGGTKISSSIAECKSNKKIFFFPAIPRVFKNFEVIFEALNQIYALGICNIRLVVTFDGTENKYAKHLRCRYEGNPLISFAGKMSPQQVKGMYNSSSALLFPSMLETWGLPISEFKSYNKPMLLADLPYAYEALGDYASAIFINPTEPDNWAKTILSIAENKTHFIRCYKAPIQNPFCENWFDLWHLMTEGL